MHSRQLEFSTLSQPNPFFSQMPDSSEVESFALESLKQFAKSQVNLLDSLANSLTPSFQNTLHHLLSSLGRVAVTGMGKSGHIGRKIAATLASTGTPAYFIHAAEASHGDLGMIGKEDTILALSVSGETAELADILNFAHRRGHVIIAITQKPQSTLAKCADQVLLIPDVPEACPIGCAPTTSTLAMLTLGDAIAMSLMQARGFTPKDFNELHPGGALGKKLLLVGSIMHSGDAQPLVASSTSMSEVLLIMTGKGFGCAGVLDATGQLIGIITDGDLRRHMNETLLQASALDVMTQNPITLSKETPLSKVVRVMNEKAITCLFITENSRPIGIIHMHDCLRAGY
ncbi:MAG: KpsF/GutQ family sugar-phosphate isomerase [Thermoguttaceae bacterium]